MCHKTENIAFYFSNTIFNIARYEFENTRRTLHFYFMLREHLYIINIIYILARLYIGI